MIWPLDGWVIRTETGPVGVPGWAPGVPGAGVAPRVVAIASVGVAVAVGAAVDVAAG